MYQCQVSKYVYNLVNHIILYLHVSHIIYLPGYLPYIFIYVLQAGVVPTQSKSSIYNVMRANHRPCTLYQQM